jgi:hypothetical protein
MRLDLVEHLTARINDRIRRYIDRGESSAILGTDALDEAGRLDRATSTLGTQISPQQRIKVTVALGRLHWHRFLALPDGEDAGDLIACLQLFVQLHDSAPDAIPEQVKELIAGLDLSDETVLFDESNEDPPIDDVIEELADSLDKLPEDDPDRAGLAMYLSALHWKKFNEDSRSRSLEESTRYSRMALDHLPPEHDSRVGMMLHLASALLIRYDYSGNRNELDESIEIAFAGLDIAEDPNISRVLHSALSDALLVRHQSFGAAEDLDRSVAHAREAVAAQDVPDASALKSAARALAVRFDARGDEADIRESVCFARAAVVTSARAAPAKMAGSLALLGHARGLLFTVDNNRATLDESIELLRDACEDPVPHRDTPTWILDLASALHERFMHYGAERDLHEALQLLDSAADIGRGSDARAARYWSNLGAILLTEAQTMLGRPDVERMVAAFSTAVRLTPPGSINRAGPLGGLGSALGLRFEVHGRPEDEDRAVDALRGAIHLSRHRPDLMAHHQSSSALALLRRFESRGARSDLEEAVALARAAARTTDTDKILRVTALSVLQVVLQTRYDLLGDASDLGEAIETGRLLLPLIGRGSPLGVQALFNLSTSLREAYERTGEDADIAEAIELLNGCLEQCGDDHPRRGVVFSDLGRSYCLRYRHNGDVEDLNRAASAGRAALAASADTLNGRLVESYLNTLLELVKRTDTDTDSDALVATAEEALRETPDGPRKAGAMHNAAVAYWHRYGKNTAADDAARAMELWREAAGSVIGPVAVRLRAALGLRDTAMDREDLTEALSASATVLSLMPAMAWHGISDADRRRLLTGTFGVAPDSAACAVRAGQLPTAVEYLEQGRTIIWSHILSMRSDLEPLRLAAPDLAIRIDEVRSQLDAGDRQMVHLQRLPSIGHLA